MTDHTSKEKPGRGPASLRGEELAQLKSKAEAELQQVADATTLEEWRIRYLGRKGAIPQLLRSVKELPAEARRVVGQVGNELREQLEQAYQERKQTVAPTTAKQSTTTSETHEGHLHPLTLAIRRTQAILASLGFQQVEGPLVETAWQNFDSLNMPLEHPARAETDTFYLAGDQVLRTSTSAVQVRAVLELHLAPPFKVFSPGRVFRSEKMDATHSHTFYQFEGLAVGEDITLADLKGTVEAFYSRFFDREVTTRLRPHFFPFVEPGLEVDLSCVFCQQKGCRVCKQTGWIEIMGAGMVHPNVLRNMNVDPQKYQGFAFGGAIDRLAMLRHGIEDIRLFWSGDLKFLRQF